MKIKITTLLILKHAEINKNEISVFVVKLLKLKTKLDSHIASSVSNENEKKEHTKLILIIIIIIIS